MAITGRKSRVVVGGWRLVGPTHQWSPADHADRLARWTDIAEMVHQSPGRCP